MKVKFKHDPATLGQSDVPESGAYYMVSGGTEKLVVWCRNNPTVMYINGDGAITHSSKEYMRDIWKARPGRPVKLKVEVK